MTAILDYVNQKVAKLASLQSSIYYKWSLINLTVVLAIKLNKTVLQYKLSRDFSRHNDNHDMQCSLNMTWMEDEKLLSHLEWPLIYITIVLIHNYYVLYIQNVLCNNYIMQKICCTCVDAIISWWRSFKKHWSVCNGNRWCANGFKD